MFQVIGQQKLLKRQPDGCGSCCACCTILGIEELDKPPNEDCRHLVSLDVAPEPPKGGCCTAYDDRPGACRTFECLWLRGVFGGQNPHHRPDRLGLMFNLQPEDFVAGPIPCGHEAWPGASREGPGLEFLEELKRRCLVLVKRLDGRPAEIIGPPTMLKDLQDKMTRHANDQPNFTSRSDDAK